MRFPMQHAALAAACALALVAGRAEAQNPTYENGVKKIITAKCNACHGSAAPTMDEFKKDEAGFKKKMKGPRMDTYPNLMVMVNGSDAGAIMRRLDDGKNGKEGKPGNMYVFLGANDAERASNLEVFKQWVGDWNLKRRKDLTEAEAKKITAPEK